MEAQATTAGCGHTGSAVEQKYLHFCPQNPCPVSNCVVAVVSVELG